MVGILSEDAPTLFIYVVLNILKVAFTIPFNVVFLSYIYIYIYIYKERKKINCSDKNWHCFVLSLFFGFSLHSVS